MLVYRGCSIAGVLQVIMQEFGGSILEGFRQRSQEHSELWGVQLEQGDQHHLSSLQYKHSVPLEED